MRLTTILTISIAASALVGCSRQPKITDTGYLGTWARGPSRGRSTIAIAKEGEAYRFRWTLTSDDDKWSVKCGWDGKCVEISDGAQIATYAFECHMDPNKKHLMVTMARTGTPRSPDTHTDHDELVVEAGGKRLWSYTIQRNDESYELGKGPNRYFDKVADSVDDPPKGTP